MNRLTISILIAIIDLFTVALLVYVGIGKRERNHLTGGVSL